MDINDISYAIRGAAFRVHHVLGPGLLESVYENALKYELEKEGRIQVSNATDFRVFLSADIG